MSVCVSLFFSSHFRCGWCCCSRHGCWEPSSTANAYGSKVLRYGSNENATFVNKCQSHKKRWLTKEQPKRKGSHSKPPKYTFIVFFRSFFTRSFSLSFLFFPAVHSSMFLALAFAGCQPVHTFHLALFLWYSFSAWISKCKRFFPVILISRSLQEKSDENLENKRAQPPEINDLSKIFFWVFCLT